jgi:hypothetical protein
MNSVIRQGMKDRKVRVQLPEREDIFISSTAFELVLQRNQLLYSGYRGSSTGIKKVNVYLPSLRMKVPYHIYVFGSLLLE